MLFVFLMTYTVDDTIYLTIPFSWLKKNQIPIFLFKSTSYIKNIPFNCSQIPIIPVWVISDYKLQESMLRERELDFLFSEKGIYYKYYISIIMQLGRLRILDRV